MAQKCFKSFPKEFDILKRFSNFLVNTAIFAFFHKTRCRWWSTPIHFQSTAFCRFFFFIKRIYCGWRSNLKQLKVKNISNRQILIEANRKKISFHSPSVDIIKNCIPHIVWEEETKPVTVISGKQEVGREKPFEINIFFLICIYCDAKLLLSILVFTGVWSFSSLSESCSKRVAFSQHENLFLWTIWKILPPFLTKKKFVIFCETADLIKWVLQLWGRAWDTRLRTEIFSQEYITRLN